MALWQSLRRAAWFWVPVRDDAFALMSASVWLLPTLAASPTVTSSREHTGTRRFGRWLCRQDRRLRLCCLLEQVSGLGPFGPSGSPASASHGLPRKLGSRFPSVVWAASHRRLFLLTAHILDHRLHRYSLSVKQEERNHNAEYLASTCVTQAPAHHCRDPSSSRDSRRLGDSNNSSGASS